MKYLNQMTRQFGERIVIALNRTDIELSKWGDPINPDNDDSVEPVTKIEVEGVVSHGGESENDEEEGDVSSGSVSVYVKADDDIRERLARFGNNMVLPERNGKRYKIVSVEMPANPTRFNHVAIRGERV